MLIATERTARKKHSKFELRLVACFTVPSVLIESCRNNQILFRIDSKCTCNAEHVHAGRMETSSNNLLTEFEDCCSLRRQCSRKESCREHSFGGAALSAASLLAYSDDRFRQS